MKSRGKKVLYASAVVMVISALLFTGCGSGNQNKSSATNSSPAADYGAESKLSLHSESQLLDNEAEQFNSVTDQSTAIVHSGSDSIGGNVAPQQVSSVNNFESGQQRKVIYNASLTIEVNDYAKAQTQLRDLVTLSRGYVLEFSDNESQYERGGHFVLKVPSNGFFDFINQLETLKPKKFQRSVQGQDVTEEYVDLESRLKAKQTVEVRLLAFMEKATRSEDLLKFSNELANVQEQIEQIKGRMRYLQQNVEFSTVQLRLYEQLKPKQEVENDKPDRPFAKRLGNALNDSVNAVLAMIGAIFIGIVSILPFLVFLLIVAIPIWLWIRRQKNNKSDNPPFQQSQTLEQNEPQTHQSTSNAPNTKIE